MSPRFDPSTKARHALLAAATAMAIQALPAAASAQVVSPPQRRTPPSGGQAPKAVKLFTGPGSPTRLIGMMAGAPVYADSAGKYFTVDPATGQSVQVSAEQVARTTCCIHKYPGRASSDSGAVASQRKPSGRHVIKFGNQDIRTVEIVGVDADGRVLHRNNRGEIFHVDPATGDFIFVKP